jgi:endonuclease-3
VAEASADGARRAPALPRIPVRRILETLASTYPEARTALDFRNPFELLLATVLSAQCTDRLVNQVTPALFAAYPDASALAAVEPVDVEPLIGRCGLYHTKARHLVAAARAIVAEHGGRVPATMPELLRLPGVGRKTANCVLANAFAVPGIAVDTHVFRVANRLGLASGRTPEQVEAQLQRRCPRARWADLHHQLIWHGRLVCHARGPRCPECPLRALCPEGRRRLAEP